MALKWGNNNWLDTENLSDVECWLWQIYFKHYFWHTKLRIFLFCFFQTAWIRPPDPLFFPNFPPLVISFRFSISNMSVFHHPQGPHAFHFVWRWRIICSITIVLGSCIISLSKLLLIQNGWLPSIHYKWMKSLALSLQASLSCAALFRLCQRCTEGRFAEVPTKNQGAWDPSCEVFVCLCWDKMFVDFKLK